LCTVDGDEMKLTYHPNLFIHSTEKPVVRFRDNHEQRLQTPISRISAEVRRAAPSCPCDLHAAWMRSFGRPPPEPHMYALTEKGIE
jgi:hypothetical protein